MKTRRFRPSAIGCQLIVLALVAMAPLSAQTRPGPPPGWTTLFDISGRCLYSVPADWKIGAAPESVDPLVASPDGRVTTVLTWSSEAAARQSAGLRRLTPPKTIHEDSSERFWIEIASPLGVLHMAIAPASDGACTVEVMASNRASEDTRRAVSTIINTLTVVR